MSFINWTILTIIAVFIRSKNANKSGKQMFRDINLGFVGAIVGGDLFSFSLGQGDTGAFDPLSLIIAIVSSIVLILYRALRGKSSFRYSELSEKYPI